MTEHGGHHSDQMIAALTWLVLRGSLPVHSRDSTRWRFLPRNSIPNGIEEITRDLLQRRQDENELPVRHSAPAPSIREGWFYNELDMSPRSCGR